MKYESLTDGSPVCILERREDVESQDKRETEQYCHCSKQRRDEEHHGAGANESNQAGVPREIEKCWSEVRS